MRRLAARAHLWGGLVSSPLLFVLGVSGSVLVFAPELARLDRPAAHAAAPAPMPSLDAVIAAAIVGQPGGEALALRVPTEPLRPFVVDVAVGGGRRLDVAVDAATLRVIDARAPERSVITAVRSLHAAFHAGRAGALLVGVLGLWLVVESATGLWLYGPALTRRVRDRSRAVHRIVGVCALAVGAIVGLTGAALAVTAFSSAGTPTSSARLARLDFVAAHVPTGGAIVRLVAEPAHRVRVETRRADGGVRAMVVDADTGEVVTASAPPDPWDVVRRLHGGHVAGWPSRLLYAAVGLALPVLAVTGFVMSFQRR